MRPTLALLLTLTLATPLLAEEKRGDNPDAKPLSAQEQLKLFKVPPGFEVQLVADETQIQKPMNLNFDAAGRLWVSGSELYPWPAKVDVFGQPVPNFEKTWNTQSGSFDLKKAPQPPEKGIDTVRILSDFGADGRAGKVQIFADKLNIPIGLVPLPRKPGAKGDTAIVYSIPTIYRMEDTDGDGKADKIDPLYEGFGFRDTHGMTSNYLYWIDGWIYGCHGFANHSEVKDRKGNVTVLDSGNTYRFKPDGSAFEYYTHGQTNPFGLTVDPMGNFYTADSHSKPVYMVLRGGYYEGIGKQHDGLGFAPRITDDDHGSSAIAGIAYYADDKFPEEYRGNLFNGNPVTRRINRDKLEWHGSSPKAIRQPDFLSCDDPWFRPVQVKLGPDGALYIADFYNPIIGHYEAPLADPRRDHVHGRIWRVVWKGEKKDAVTPALPNFVALDTARLIKKLNDPNLIVRTLATHDLVERHGTEAVTIVAKALAETAGGKGNGSSLSSPDSRVHAWWVASRVKAASLEDLMGAWSDPSPVVRAHLPALLSVAKATGRTGGPAASASLLKSLTDADAGVRRAGTSTLSSAGAVNLGALLQLWDKATSDDVELIYAIKVAMRDSLSTEKGYRDAAQFLDQAANITRIADVSLAVKTPQAAEFLLSYLQRTKLTGGRAGEYLRHVALNLPAEKFSAVVTLMQQFGEAPLAQKLAVADGLSAALRQSGAKLPPDLMTWMQRVMVEALESPDPTLLDRAIAAVRDSKIEEKFEPLKKIALDAKGHGPRRAAALEALVNLNRGGEVLVAALNDPSSMTSRKKAAELLGANVANSPALLAALPNAPTELGVSIATGLVKSEDSCGKLLDLIEGGKVSATVLRAKPVADALSKREKGLQARATSLTKDLPPEDARLDGVITARVDEFRKLQPDAAKGALVFQQNCVVCHRFRNEGGNVGPNLDGTVARGLHRLIEDILDPNRNVDPAFRQTIIETKSGGMVVGANIRDAAASITLTDATGKDVNVAKADIKTQTQSRLSLMPPAFETAIAPADFSALLAYLLNPGK